MLHKYNQVKLSSWNSGFMLDLFDLFKLKTFLKQVRIIKQKGHSIEEMLFIFMLIVLNNSKSIYSGLSKHQITKFKTPINDMLNNQSYCWRSLLFKVAKQFIKLSNTKDLNNTYLIFDDTSKEKTGKKTEGISWFRNHSKGMYFKGFQNITTVWSNGTSSIPIDFEFKIGKKRVKRSKRPKCRKGTHTAQRNFFGKKKKTEIVIASIKRVLQRKIPFKYVLWDSWFNSTTTYKFVFNSLVPKGKILISMLKKGKQKYKYKGKYLDLKELYKRAGNWETTKDTGIKYKSIVVSVLDVSSSKKISNRIVINDIKISFYRYPGVSQWKAILSTDTSLTEIEVLKVYLKRWSIECTFKEIKQYFGYNQSKSSKYGAMIADLSIRYMFYTMLCLKKAQNNYKSMEQLLIDFHERLEESVLNDFVILMVSQQLKELMDYALANGYKTINELKKDIDIVLTNFFKREHWIDKIEEADSLIYS